MIKSKIISLSNRYHFYALLLLFLLLPFINPLYLIVLILYVIYLLIFKLFNRYVLIFMTILFSLFIFKLNQTSNISDTKTVEVVITERDESDTRVKYIAKYKNEFVLIYDYNKTSYIPGDVVLINGEISDITNFNDFDYETYSHSLKRYKQISLKSSKLVKHSNNLYYLRYLIEERYKDKLTRSEYTYFNSLVLAKTIDDDTLKDNINKLGISYMFVVSGFHISLLILLIEKILRLFIKKNDTLIDIISISLILIYTIITLSPVGILRAFIMNILRKINKRFNLLLTSLDIISITFIICLIINPLYIFQAAFKYSFLSTLFIILGSSLIKTQSKVLNSYLVTVLCFLACLPLTINLNYKINFLSLIISPILLVILSYVIMPISYILVLIPESITIFESVLELFTDLINLLSEFDNLIIAVRKLNPIFIIIYYLTFFFVLVSIESKKNYKIIGFYIFYLILIFNLKNINICTTLTMINVGQGDSLLISDNNKYLCIDSYSTNISYIESRGIEEIDSLVITHSDDDHMGSAKELIQKFHVKNLYLSKYDDLNKTKELSDLVKNTYYLSKGDYFYFNKIYFNVLGPKNKNSDVNNNSLVFVATINNNKVLFTGDMEEEEEMQIFDSKLNVDILKVPHHGSNSSMSDYFIERVEYDTALISVGINNKYKHPSTETLDKLKDKKVYKTSTDESITLYFLDSKYYTYINRFEKYFIDLVTKGF